MQAIHSKDNFTESRLPLLTWRKFFQGQHFHMLKPSFLLHVLLYALRHPLLSVPVPRTQQHPANTSAYGQSWVYWLFSVDVIGKWHRDSSIRKESWLCNRWFGRSFQEAVLFCCTAWQWNPGWPQTHDDPGSTTLSADPTHVSHFLSSELLPFKN